MKTNLKKRIAAIATTSAVAMATIFSTTLTANAYNDIAGWYLYTNPNVSHTSETFKLNFYSAGYRARITNKDFGGAQNYVIISEFPLQRAMLTEVGATCQPFQLFQHVDSNGVFFAQATVRMYVEDAETMTPYNNGQIGVSNKL